MNKFTKIVLAVLGALFALCIVVSFIGCDQVVNDHAPVTNEPANPVPPVATQQPAAKLPTFNYDLPQGWEWNDGPGSYSITTKNGSRDGSHGFMKMESEVRPGTDANAKTKIKDSFEAETKLCKKLAASTDPDDQLNRCEKIPKYKEIKIGDTTVYMSIDWCNADIASWCTNFEFAIPGTSNRYIWSGVIYDRGNLYTPEFKTIINSLHIVQ